MMGLMYLLAFAVYLALSAAIVAWAVRHARMTGKSASIRGLGAALVMWLIPFWDWIPTVIMHKYYCETEAGFWVYKTVDQWKKENPGVLERIVANKGAPSKSERSGDERKRISTYFLNDKFNWVVSHEDISTSVPIIRTEEVVVDTARGEALARYVDFGTGNSVRNTVGPPGPLKFWLSSKHCTGGDMNESQMYWFKHAIRGAEK